LPQFKGYASGDIIGKQGVERVYDRFLRGTPGIQRVVVNSLGEPTQTRQVQRQRPGPDLVLSLDEKIQRETQRALKSGLAAARGAGFAAPAGSAVVMDPKNGQILALASLPTYDPAIAADGLSTKEFDRLGAATPNDPDDDAFLNRPIQASANPGSTFKVVTAGAAMATGVATPYSTRDCPGSITIPPEGGPGSVQYHNWTFANSGIMGFPVSLEVSCDTFYYELGYEMQTRFGVSGTQYWVKDKTNVPPGKELFQRYARKAGMGDPTGIDLPYESGGVVPDQKWCHDQYLATKSSSAPTCQFGWLPGYTVNMSIGQGDMRTTPLQMAVTYAAIANGGTVWAPKIGMSLERQREDGTVKTLREFKPKPVAHLPLDDIALGVIRQGLQDVISSPNGTAYSAFAGFPLSKYPIAGKTGTAQIGTSVFNDSWFISYGPTTDPRYVIAVYVQKAGHGGESAAPIARQIWESIFGIDKNASVTLGQDQSG
jgi:penicillin-binding protein 2